MPVRIGAILCGLAARNRCPPCLFLSASLVPPPEPLLVPRLPFCGFRFHNWSFLPAALSPPHWNHPYRCFPLSVFPLSVASDLYCAASVASLMPLAVLLPPVITPPSVMLSIQSVSASSVPQNRYQFRDTCRVYLFGIIDFAAIATATRSIFPAVYRSGLSDHLQCVLQLFDLLLIAVQLPFIPPSSFLSRASSCP